MLPQAATHLVVGPSRGNQARLEDRNCGGNRARVWALRSPEGGWSCQAMDLSLGSSELPLSEALSDAFPSGRGKGLTFLFVCLWVVFFFFSEIK